MKNKAKALPNNIRQMTAVLEKHKVPSNTKKVNVEFPVLFNQCACFIRLDMAYINGYLVIG